MLKLFNTLSRKKEELKPLHKQEVGVYTCGPTVYDFAHIGNLRAYIFSDVLHRTIEYHGWKLKHVMNITDVGHLTGDRDMGADKIEQAASTTGKNAWELASVYTDAFLKDLSALNIRPVSKLVKASDHIADQIELIKVLENKGFTYRTRDGIYFDTSNLADYGKLAKLDLEGLREGARVEKNPEKKNPTDFALWKFSYPNGTPFDPAQGGAASRRQMEWDSPWGVGFPGWHIECSAMSRKYLGQPFDIHTGGVDHIPVHHTNEIAQSEAAFEQPLANFWLHSEFITINGGRMGKSESNLITIDELINKGYQPLSYRYFVLQGHYRTKLNFTWEALDAAQNSLHNLYASVASAKQAKIGCAEFEKRFFAGIDDDLDTPKALAVMWEMLKTDYPPESKLESLLKFDQILGLSIESTWQEMQKPLPGEIQKLVRQREEFRKTKDWEKADDWRKKIADLGFIVNDTENGPVLIKKFN